MRWMDTKSRLQQEKGHNEARSAVLMAQAARAAHEKTLRYGTRLRTVRCQSMIACSILQVAMHSHLDLAACHELRNPLHAIMATLTFLMDDATLTKEQSSDIEVLFTCASHMQRLVNDVLDIAKLREGSLKIQAVQVSTPPLAVHQTHQHGVVSPASTASPPS